MVKSLFKHPSRMTRNELELEVINLRKLLNTPETEDFLKGVESEIPHQNQEWRQSKYVDTDKLPEDWFGVAVFLAHKARLAAESDDREKALHHCISTAALMGNWHAQIKRQMESE